MFYWQSVTAASPPRDAGKRLSGNAVPSTATPLHQRVIAMPTSSGYADLGLPRQTVVGGQNIGGVFGMKKLLLLLFAALLVVPAAVAQDTLSSSDAISAQSGTINTTTQRRHHKHHKHHHPRANAQ